MRPRIYGSSESHLVLSSSSPGPGCGTGNSSRRKSLAFGSPTGRDASTMRRAVSGISNSVLNSARIIRALARDRHIVHMALAQAGRGDAHEVGLGMQVRHVLRADIAHGGAKAAGELVQHG